MRYLLFIVAFTTLSDRVHAQILVTTAELDIPGYADALNNIVKNQIVDHRTVDELKLWEYWLRPNDPNPVAITRKVAIHGKELWVSRFSAQPPAGNGKTLTVQLLSPDAYYFLRVRPEDDKYTVLGHGTAWKDVDRYENTGLMFSACVQIFQPKNVKELLGTTDDEFEGRPTKRIAILTTNGVNLTTHIDRKTYQHIYSEYDKVLDTKTRSYVEEKEIFRTEYRSEGGRLWPTRHEQSIHKPNGKKYPIREIVFLEYAPYTPKPDELDIEKQFGVKPIPHEPRPDSAKPKPPASRTRMWLYAVAGVLAATAIGIVAIRRRKKA